MSNDRTDRIAGISLTYIVWSLLECGWLVKDANLTPQATEASLSPT